MNYFVFHVSDQSAYGKQRTGMETYNFLVGEKNAWGFGQHTANRKAIQPGDKALFYLTGSGNQVFLGTATLKSGAYEDSTQESQDWYLDKNTLRIDLQDKYTFPEPKSLKNFKSIEWRPAQGGSSKISQHDYDVIVGAQPDQTIGINDVEGETAFVLEKYLEDFIVSNWDKIDFGEKLTLYIDKDGNTGQQYYTNEVGYIDILAKDENGDYVVIELKKGRENDVVVGQVLRYMGWVRKNLASSQEEVRGMIIVGDKDVRLEYALKEIGGKISTKLYSINFKLNSY